MVKQTVGSIVVGAWLLAAVGAEAHHSLAATYDIRGEGTVTGVITAVKFTNPHGAIELDVPNADGTKTGWTMTTGSANTLSGLGFGRGGQNTVTAGDLVTITYYPARNGNPLGFIRTITLPDAREIEFEIE